MLQKAVRICDAKFGNIYRWDGEFLHLLAAHNTPRALAEARKGSPLRPSLIHRTLETKTATHIVDVAADPDYVKRRAPGSVAAVELGGVRTFLSVPMLKENEMIGSFSLYREEVRPFTDKQIELVTNFAAQAVIAIENSQLLNELRKSLAQQTATADVLKVISRSTFDLQTVLDTLLQSAARLCDAPRGVMLRQDGGLYHGVAFYNASPEIADFVRRHPITPGRHTVTARVALERQIIHVADLQADAEYKYALRDIDPIRTELGVPMFRGEDVVGIIILYKFEVRPFTDQQIDLVRTFADHDSRSSLSNRVFSIAMTAWLQRQTATADVLKVISRSTFDLQIVLDTLTELAARLCSADNGVIFQRDGDLYRFGANYGFSPKSVRYALEHPLRPSRGSMTGRVALEGRAIHIPDVLVALAFMI